MESNEPCGAPTLANEECSWKWDECPVFTHRRWRVTNGLPPSARNRAHGGGNATPRTSPAPSNSKKAADGEKRPRPEPPPAIETRDMHGLGWWAMARMIEGALSAADVGAIATVLRTLSGLPPDGDSEEENLANIALHGLLMHGIPPRNEAEWARARAQFDDDALAEMRRWASLQGDAGDQGEPLRLGNKVADEVDVAGVVDHEDGG